jgi:hypothetical protein
VPVDQPPVITNGHALESPIAQNPPKGFFCANSGPSQIAEGVYANVSDPDDSADSLIVSFTWALGADGTNGSGRMTQGDGIFAGQFVVDYAQSHARGGTITITEFASDPDKEQAEPVSFTVELAPCSIESNPSSAVR